MSEDLLQIKLDALSAKNLHRNRLWRFNVIKIITSILTIIVPILFIIAIYITKATKYEVSMNIVSFIFSILLICFSVAFLIFKIDDKIITHKFGLKNNLSIASEIDNLLMQKEVSEQNLEWFKRYVTEFYNTDNDTFGQIKEKERKKIYRNALKELQPGNYRIVCPICKASPWEFKIGNCQLCGNTPKAKLDNSGG